MNVFGFVWHFNRLSELAELIRIDFSKAAGFNDTFENIVSFSIGMIGFFGVGLEAPDFGDTVVDFG